MTIPTTRPTEYRIHYNWPKVCWDVECRWGVGEQWTLIQTGWRNSKQATEGMRAWIKQAPLETSVLRFDAEGERVGS